MHARVAAFENPRFADPSLVDELAKRARESAPRWREALPDARGYLMLVDKERNRSLGITFFESEDAIREAEPVFERMGDEMPEELRGRRVSVDAYEVAILDVDEGARAARVSNIEGPSDRVDDATREARENIVPKLRELSGSKGVVALVDRTSGRLIAITLWESPEAMRATDEQADRMREESAEAGAGRVVGVERYEVQLAERLAELEAIR